MPTRSPARTSTGVGSTTLVWMPVRGNGPLSANAEMLSPVRRKNLTFTTSLHPFPVVVRKATERMVPSAVAGPDRLTYVRAAGGAPKMTRWVSMDVFGQIRYVPMVCAMDVMERHAAQAASRIDFSIREPYQSFAADDPLLVRLAGQLAHEARWFHQY